MRKEREIKMEIKEYKNLEKKLLKFRVIEMKTLGNMQNSSKKREKSLKTIRHIDYLIKNIRQKEKVYEFIEKNINKKRNTKTR